MKSVKPMKAVRLSRIPGRVEPDGPRGKYVQVSTLPRDGSVLLALSGADIWLTPHQAEQLAKHLMSAAGVMRISGRKGA